MKPETKFKRAVVSLAKQHGLPVISVETMMSGLDSRSKKAWRTFSLNLGQNASPDSSFLSKLEAMASKYDGIHALTGLPFEVHMAVRRISCNGVLHVFMNGQMAEAAR